MDIINLIDKLAVLATIILMLAGMSRMIYREQYYHDKNRNR